jgi:dTDP-glucose 4,6-dehydratase/UDP-glucose 4-epimerase
VEALLLAGVSNNANGRVYNLGSSEIISLSDLAEIMVNLGISGNYELAPFPVDRKAIDIGDYYSDYSLIKKELGWAPKIDLKVGLKRTLNYYRAHFSHYWDK